MTNKQKFLAGCEFTVTGSVRVFYRNAQSRSVFYTDGEYCARIGRITDEEIFIERMLMGNLVYTSVLFSNMRFLQ